MTPSQPFIPIDFSAAAQEAALLRLLLRLEFVSARHIHTLIYPGVHRTTVWRTLNRLHQERLIWRKAVGGQRVPGAAGRGGTPAQATPHLYGLTPHGLEAVQACDDHPEALERAIVRDWKNPEVKLSQLAHDMLVIDWCVSALAEARQSSLVQGVRCVLEYISVVDAEGKPRQRFDALFLLQFGEPNWKPRQPWTIPWATVDHHGGPQHCLSIEVDRGTEKLATLMGKAIMYGDLTRYGFYERGLGGPVLPVFLVPTTRRAAQIAREWRQGWPGGPGVIAPFGPAQDSPYGALWGRYRAMADPAMPRQTLFEGTGITLEYWQTARLDTVSMQGTTS
jgi:hypothetical protein